MKKFLLLVLFIGTTLTTCWAQEKHSVNFQLTENGSFIAPDGKNYFVFEYPNESQSDVYNKYLVAITGIYVSPKDVISKVENQMISIKGYKSEAITNTLLGVFSSTYDIEYVLKFQFKDGKVKVEAPEIVKLRQSVGNSRSEYGISTFIQNNKLFKNEIPEQTGNEKKDEKAKKRADKKNQTRKEYLIGLNGAVNKLLNNIITKTNKNQSEDW